MKKAVLIYPNQLFEKHPLVTNDATIILIEDACYFTDFKFHKQKLILHRASMKAYEHQLYQEKNKVIYLDNKHAEELFKTLKEKTIIELACCDPVDHLLEERLKKACKKNSINLSIHPTPAFLTPISWFEKLFKDKKQYSHARFYQAQRKRLKILITKDNKPVGGKWSFDAENRKPLPDKIQIPKRYEVRKTEWIKEAVEYIEKKFAKNPGNADTFWFPVTHNQAKTWLDKFLEDRFNHFGDYEDAINKDQLVLFHSVLSPVINSGLLTPDYVVEKTLAYAKQHKVSINNVEGFIRQIIGWREFICCMYKIKGKEQRDENFFQNKKEIPELFYTAKTGIKPVDDAISDLYEYAYNHHIIRLMILGNFMLLCSINPDEVYRWFMELYIDAYDWVMVPNVYGMSQYADGGLMTTKPYISSSNYVLKMSNYKKDKDWCPIWDALYWDFIDRNKKYIAKNPRLKIMLSYLKRIKPEKLKSLKETASNYLKQLN